MSPPINTPDGSEVSEIVLPDGSTASEVIGPDGNVVFEAAPDIPDAAIAQYDATEISGLSDGEAVSTWSDSINANDLSAVGGPTYKTGVKNNNPVVRYDGTGDAHEDTDFSETQPFTVCIVVKPEQTGTLEEIYCNDVTTSADLRADSSGSWSIQNDISGGSYDGASFYLVTAVHDSGGTSVLRVNGSEVASGSIAAEDLDGLNVAANASDGEFYMQGDIGEMVIYNDHLTSTEISNEESRLSDKWGIAI